MLDVMECLKDGVPLSLLLDLLSSDGPNAHKIFAEEDADLSWTVHLAADTADTAPTAHRARA